MSLPLTLTLAAALAAGPQTFPLDLDAPSPWELGVAAGGGWDSNPIAASAPVSSGFGTARAWIARRFEASSADDVWLQLRYDGARYDSTPEVDLDRPELSLEWAHAFGERITTLVAGRGALRLQGEDARSGWDASARALVRARLLERIGLRLGAAFIHREADDAVFTSSVGRADGGVDVTLWKGASATARYTLDVGTDAVYSTTASGGFGGGYRGGMGGGGGMYGTASSSRRVVHGAAADVLQVLPGGLFLQAGYGLGVERDAGVSYVTHSVLAEVGWRR